MAALVAGGGTQILLVSYEQLWLRQPLDSISPLLTEHGVLVGLALSAFFFVTVSLATPREPDIRLAPFFPDIAEGLFGRELPRADRKSADYRQIVPGIEEKTAGERTHLNLYLDHTSAHSCATGEGSEQDLPWQGFVQRLTQRHRLWFTPTGSHIVYRLSQADMLACVKMVRGDESQIWLSAEPRLEQRERLKDELFLATLEISDVLKEFGVKAGSR